MKKHNVSLISYLNSRPFLYGLENSPIKDGINIFLDIPSRTAEKIATNRTDIGLIPVGALADMSGYSIVSDFCIGAEGPVRTVILASKVPLEEVDTILMDYQSRSSVLLTQVLARFFWKREFNWEKSRAGYEKKSISGRTAGVVIGDRVFQVEKMNPFIYDLSSEWMKYTGLPFVFAVWVTKRHLSSTFLDRFNLAIEYGIKSVPEVEKLIKSEYPDVDIIEYFTKNISYAFDERKKAGMNLFMQLAQEMKFSAGNLKNA